MRRQRGRFASASRTWSYPVSPRRTRLRVEELETRVTPTTGVMHLASVVQNTYSPPYNPQDITYAYGFQNIKFLDSHGHRIKGDGTGQTIAIVDAFDNPNIQADLDNFDTTWNLPAITITKLDQTGAPVVGQVQGDTGWGLEIALDVEWAHALAPKANIVLFEAFDNSYENLLAAVTTAANYAGVGVVSNSWGSGEFTGENGFDSIFTTPDNHVTFVFSSGDSGAPPIYPSVSPNVLAVGGTTLNLKTNAKTGLPAYAGESGWHGSGGGPSAIESEPSWQQGVQQTGSRTSPDVAFDANPATGVYVYDTYGYGGALQVGGTSFSAPAWGALLTIVNQGRAMQGKGTLGNAQIAVYSLPATDFHDVKTGSNGYPAHVGYDYVTGLGSPKAALVARDLAAVASSPAAAQTTKAATVKKPTGTFQPLAAAVSVLSATMNTTATTVTVAAQTVVAATTVANIPVTASVTIGGTVAAVRTSAGFSGVSTGDPIDRQDSTSGFAAPSMPATPVAPVNPAAPLPRLTPEIPLPALVVRDEWFVEDGFARTMGSLPADVAAVDQDGGSAVDPAALAAVAAFAGGAWVGQARQSEARKAVRLPL